MQAKPEPQHAWLQKLVGEWTTEVQAIGAPGQPSETLRGSETVRSVGGLWVVAEGKGQMPGGGEAVMILTVGYDPEKKAFVGTWLGSMMTNLWVYTGHLDGDTLTLETEGPNWEKPGTTANYREVIEVKSDDHRTFSSFVQADDGSWKQIMKADYRRVK